VLRFNLSLFNKASGFYANHSPNSPIFQNNTAFKNGANYNMTGVGSDGSTTISVGVLRNNVAFGSTATSDANLSGPIDSANNSWDAKPSLMVSNADFASVAFVGPASCPEPYKAGGTVCVPTTDMSTFGGLASARQADGSLPVLPLLHLAAGSQLVDKGVEVGQPFVGSAPDLGAFELGANELGTAADSGATPVAGASGSAGTHAAAGSVAAPVGGTSGGAMAQRASSAGAGTGLGATPASTVAAGNAGRTSTTTSAAQAAAPARAAAGAAGSGSGLPTSEPAATPKSGCSCQVGRPTDTRVGLGLFAASGVLLFRSRRSRRSRRGTRS
jgi:hypothetical protein